MRLRSRGISDPRRVVARDGASAREKAFFGFGAHRTALMKEIAFARSPAGQQVSAPSDRGACFGCKMPPQTDRSKVLEIGGGSAGCRRFIATWRAPRLFG